MFRVVLLMLWLAFVSFSHTVSAQSQSQKIEILGVDGELKSNVEGFTRRYQTQTLNHQQLHNSVSQALQALGYYHSQISLEAERNNETLVINIKPGEPLSWNEINVQVDGDAKKDTVFSVLLTKLPIQVDQTVRHDFYQQAKSNIESLLLERGYFDFKWLRKEMLIDKRARLAKVFWHLDSGNRYRFGTLNISKQTQATQYIQSLATFDPKSMFDSALLSDYTLALNATPYFRSAKVYPLLNRRQNGSLPIRVEVVDKPANSFEVGGGYSTDLGAKGRLKWTKPWITNDGHFLEGNLSVSQRRQDITGSYTVPVLDPNNDVWRILGGYQVNDDLQEGIESKIWNIQLQRQWLISDSWVRTAFIKREHETTEQEDKTFKTEMLLPGISYAKKQTKGGTTPYWANEQLISLEVASDSLVSSTSLVKARWNNAWLRSYEQKHFAISRINLGAIVVDDINAVPFNMRFFAGGDQSIRGFAYRSVGPKEDNKDIGGKYLATGSLEYNYQFLPSWRAALFIDAGTATNDFSEKWSVGAGFGFRYITPIGPIRIDHAWGVSKKSKSTRLSIVIGPEI
ncbi:Translocation and assembly module subunit TamA [Pseudoalteromonas sp. CIP111854]|uniref:Translocation and assembly module subunit TamA n=1 Tax=Pseudoalteromonas holothuriae TaxID=2963714 RepID=A0A9W4R3W3_9GAMM|nr:autotransporter assembly complex family protein [Pseudoalteromonas sp. CIP111854]CAH9064944.1 Translocation and assembly module subunit TamA [Pseudoalteromonas sp. CIP111854]